MPASAAAANLRIAVIGLSGEEVDWTARLAGRGVEVVPIHDVSALAGADVHLGVVFAPPERVAELMPQITGHPYPFAVLVDRGVASDQAPQVSLLEILLSGLRDVSERREHQERMQRSTRFADIGQLAAGIAHEINTPLASIALRAESLLKSAADPRLLAVDSFKNFPRYLKTIEEEIFRCKKIIGALLEFSRTRRPEVRDTDLNQLAEKAADLVGHQIRLKQVALSLSLDPGLPHVTADDAQLRHALLALIMNALDATPAGGRIEVATARAGENMVAMTVSDTGVGIPRDQQARIFTPFFTTKPVGQGTGLGLSACQGIVAAHGGEIRVESEVGVGTRIAMLLPLARPAGAGPA